MVFLGLGSNEGDRLKFIQKALKAIETSIGPISVQSNLYTTKPWGFREQNDFINMVVGVTTVLSPWELLNKIKEIEKNIGRVARSKWHEREIDIDIIFYKNEVINSEYLKIPHPYFYDRNFVLVPLAEIAPDFKDPRTSKDIRTLLSESGDESSVVPLTL